LSNNASDSAVLTDRPRRGPMKLKLSTIVKALLIVVCFAFLVKIVVDLGPARVWAAAREANVYWLLACVPPLFMRYWLWGLKWRLMVARRRLMPQKLMHRLILAASFINNLTPTAKLGGGFLRAIILSKRTGWRLSEAYGWVFADQITNFYGKMFLFGVLLCLAPLLLPDAPQAMAMFWAGLGCFALSFSWLPTRPRLRRWAARSKSAARLSEWFPKMLRKRQRDGRSDWLKQALDPLLSQGATRQILTVDIMMGGLSFYAFCLSNAVAMKALGAEAPLLTICLMVMVGYLASTVLGLTGGIGVTELFLIELFIMIGISDEIATAGALLHRAIFYAYNLAIGGWAAWREGARKPPEAAA